MKQPNVYVSTKNKQMIFIKRQILLVNIWPWSGQCVAYANDLKETSGEEVEEEDQSESLKELYENRWI